MKDAWEANPTAGQQTSVQQLQQGRRGTTNSTSTGKIHHMKGRRAVLEAERRESTQTEGTCNPCSVHESKHTAVIQTHDPSADGHSYAVHMLSSKTAALYTVQHKTTSAVPVNICCTNLRQGLRCLMTTRHWVHRRSACAWPRRRKRHRGPAAAGRSGRSTRVSGAYSVSHTGTLDACKHMRSCLSACRCAFVCPPPTANTPAREVRRAAYPPATARRPPTHPPGCCHARCCLPHRQSQAQAAATRCPALGRWNGAAHPHQVLPGATAAQAHS